VILVMADATFEFQAKLSAPALGYVLQLQGNIVVHQSHFKS